MRKETRTVMQHFQGSFKWGRRWGDSGEVAGSKDTRVGLCFEPGGTRAQICVLSGMMDEQ